MNIISHHVELTIEQIAEYKNNAVPFFNRIKSLEERLNRQEHKLKANRDDILTTSREIFKDASSTTLLEEDWLTIESFTHSVRTATEKKLNWIV